MQTVNLPRKLLFFVVITSILFSCATPVAYVDYDEEVNFDKYVSYNFYAPETVLSEVEEDTIMGFIEENLQAKGLESKLISKFSIDFFVEFFDVENPVVTDTGYAMFNNNTPYMTLTISFADALTSELFWQAVVERKISRNTTEEKRIELYKEFIKMALDRYPPSPDDSPNAKKENQISEENDNQTEASSSQKEDTKD